MGLVDFLVTLSSPASAAAVSAVRRTDARVRARRVRRSGYHASRSGCSCGRDRFDEAPKLADKRREARRRLDQHFGEIAAMALNERRPVAVDRFPAERLGRLRR
jgi:hypothetical protein